jgi:hypothetical protein
MATSTTSSQVGDKRHNMGELSYLLEDAPQIKFPKVASKKSSTRELNIPFSPKRDWSTKNK